MHLCVCRAPLLQHTNIKVGDGGVHVLYFGKVTVLFRGLGLVEG